MSDFTPGPWSRDYIYWLLRFGRKNSGGWDDHVKIDEFAPDEDDAALISAALEMYASLQSVEWVEFHFVQSVTYTICPWCRNEKVNGHKDDCQRQAALRKAEGRDEK